MPCTYPEAGWRIAQINKILSNISWTVFCWNRAIRGLIRGMSMWIWKKSHNRSNFTCCMWWNTKTTEFSGPWESVCIYGNDFIKVFLFFFSTGFYSPYRTLAFLNGLLNPKGLPICLAKLKWMYSGFHVAACSQTCLYVSW
jgi:hypothetical protein